MWIIRKLNDIDYGNSDEIYHIIMNVSDSFDEKLVREFAVELTKKIQERFYIGWH